jgi:large subunit ribosomal protein L21
LSLLLRLWNDPGNEPKVFSAKKTGVDTDPGVCFLPRPPVGGKFLCTLFWKPAVSSTASLQATIEIELLPATAGQVHTFDRVLLINKEGNVTVGNPVIAGATIKADVVEHIRGDKVVAFKMRRRKGYHKKIGHRQELTVVKVTEING